MNQCNLDALRDIQIQLKREDAFLEFYSSESNEMNMQHRSHFQSYMIHLKFLYKMSKLASSQITAESISETVAGFFDPSIREKSLQFSRPPINSRPYFVVASLLYANPNLFAKSLIDVSKSHPERMENLINSSIPAIYGFLSTEELANSFAELIGELVPSSLSLSLLDIVLFHPCVRLFTKFCRSLTPSLTSITDSASADKFASSFLSAWKARASLFPKLAYLAISAFPQPVQALSYLLQKALQNADLFSLSDCPPPQHCIEIAIPSIEKISETLWQSLKDSESHYQILSNSDFYFNLSPMSDFLVVTNNDLIDLKLLAQSASTIDKSFSIHIKDLMDPSAAANLEQPFVIDITTKDFPSFTTTTMKGSSFKGDLANCQLGQILVNLPTIPQGVKYQDSVDLGALLTFLLRYLRTDNSILIELRIGTLLANMEKKDIGSFISSLKESIAERQEHCRSCLSDLSGLGRATLLFNSLEKDLNKLIEAALNSFRYRLLSKWIEQRNFDANDTSLSTSESFSQFFTELRESLKSWLSANSIFIIDDSILLHGLIMNGISIDRFKTLHPQLAEEDAKCFKGMTEKKNEILSKIKDEFVAPFFDHSEYIGKAVEILKECFAARLPLRKASILRKFLKEICSVAESFVDHDAGENEFTPLRILALINAQPSDFFSQVTYISTFLSVLSDKEDIQDVLTIIEALKGHIQLLLQETNGDISK